MILSVENTKFSPGVPIYRIVFLLSLPVFVFMFGCTNAAPLSSPQDRPKPYKIGRKWYQPISSAQGFTQTGIASWYGQDFHGKITANGEIYDMHEMTAAHKTLPLDTYVSVHNLENDKSIVVRLNDRGPFVRGRIIDLSFAAAKKLGIVDKGTTRVRIVALGTAKKTVISKNVPRKYIPGNYYSGTFTFQVGAFKNRNNAEKLRQQLDTQYKNAHLSPYNDGHETLYRVRVGSYNSLEEIIKDESVLIEKGFKDTFIVAQ